MRTTPQGALKTNKQKDPALFFFFFLVEIPPGFSLLDKNQFAMLKPHFKKTTVKKARKGVKCQMESMV